MTSPSQVPQSILLDEPRVPLGAQCCECGRFVGQDAAIHIESGDYGTLYSVEFECRRCHEAS